MAEAQHPRSGQNRPTHEGQQQIDERILREQLKAAKDINKPLRKALTVRNGILVYECLDACFKELKKPENMALLRKAGEALKGWNQAEKARAGVKSVGDIPLETRIKFAERAVHMVKEVRDRLMIADATGLRIPSGSNFTNSDNHEARWRIVELATNAVVVSKGYANTRNAEEVVNHFVASTPGSISGDFKKILAEQAWVASY